MKQEKKRGNKEEKEGEKRKRTSHLGDSGTKNRPTRRVKQGISPTKSTPRNINLAVEKIWSSDNVLIVTSTFH